MRLSVDAGFRLFAIGLTTAALAGCALAGRADSAQSLATIEPAASGPAADFPIVLGAPFTVDGVLYTPADTMNYDVVGYAAIDAAGGVTLAHRTLPLPSYVEVTSLVSGKTILARVERRGPMTGDRLVSLSAPAASQLEAGEGTPVRIRRVNPPERDRAELRAGRSAPARMATPRSLVEVLRRKLPASDAASVRASIPSQPDLAKGSHEPVTATADGGPRSTGAFPLAPLGAGIAPGKPVVVARPRQAPSSTSPAAKAVEKAAPPASSDRQGFVVQAAAFAVRENAEKAATALGGHVSQSGRYYRVRTGPFTSRGQAEAALAKVRAAGYSDARVYSAG
ncbi:SPOR domain-containing protein [Tsuneonella sp. SYSU-LHT278]|uniref:SPOR domain-containing protein n=1 Tax=Tsuneonella sediminis TaxID=3416089 RepID=UPI003F7A3AED